MAFLTGDNTPLPQMAETSAEMQQVQSFQAGNASTTFTLNLGSLELPGTNGNLYNAKSATVVIANLGTAQTINAATLSFLDTINTLNAEVDYALTSVSVASGATQTFNVNINGAILENAQLSVTFASAPVAGSVGVLAIFRN